jgi:hypothetical protein
MTNILRSRQVHLDFHTSGEIPGIGKNFDAKAFVKTFKDAHVNSVTVFSRCHHGYIYHPSKLFPERVHPHLSNKNLMLEQVNALHAEGIKAPVYITVQWDRYTAERHADWLIRKQDGAHEGGCFTKPGFYQSLCVNTGYWDFLAAQTREVIELLGNKPDGFFFDIVGIRPCLCFICRNQMKERGYDFSDGDAVLGFAMESINRFKEKMTALVREYSTDATVFYNAGHVGPCTAASSADYSHFELESLPSHEQWGYLHFPISARYARTLGKDCMGMTGKFHISWGDFHSLKNLEALEFECFRMLSYGYAASIGDQLEPNGTLNPATYRLIGKVYDRIAQCEPWARPSIPLVEAALITTERPDGGNGVPESIKGAAQMLEELALQFDIVTPDADLSRYKLIILPDDLTADGGLTQRIEDYVASGGAVIACFKGGSNAAGCYPPCFGVEPWEENNNYPDFIIGSGPLAAGLEPENEYAIYQQGLRVKSAGAKTALEARAPYFPREGDRFCSHRYTPSAKGEAYPAAYKNGNVLLFTHPLFGQYRENAPKWCKLLMNNAIEALLPNRLVRHNGPSTLTVSLLHQPEHHRLAAHLLSYIPVRKSASIDIVEDRTPAFNLGLAFGIPGKIIKTARLVPENIPLPLKGNAVTVPEVNGYAIVELEIE